MTRQFEEQVPLCVDLDGTIIRTDILYESILLLLKKDPWKTLHLPFWLMKGKAFLKNSVANEIDVSVTHLPYNHDLISYLKSQKEAGRQIILVTASHRKYAAAIANHLGLFTEVLATEENTNLSGENKRDLLLSMFGSKGFDYIGNAKADLAIWPHSLQSIIVDAHPNVLRQAINSGNVTKVFRSQGFSLKTLLRAMRVHQWLKNLLLFIPLFAAHDYGDLIMLKSVVLAFISFSFCASSVYIINDLLDLESDRSHPRKRHRPFAAGHLSIRSGIALAPLLLAASVAIGVILPIKFLFSLIFYLILTFAYSLWMKRVIVLDIVALAILYTIRIIGGGLAVDMQFSFWLLAFSVFFFLSLAMIKRYSELWTMKKEGQVKAHGRGYHTEDFPVILSLGTASSFVATLVFCLYINSPEVKVLYRYPEVLWTLIPILLFWISRAWIITHRGEMHDDPVLFAIRDRTSLLLSLLLVVIVLGAR